METKKIIKIIIGAVIAMALTACGCEHEYNEGAITKEATFAEEGEKVYTCSLCGDTYTESIPVREDEVVVTVLDKINLSENWDAGRYSNRVEFVFEIQNMTDQNIKGVQGILKIMDLFGTEILQMSCDFTGQTIEPKGKISISNLGMDINQFMDSHSKLYEEKFADLKFEYEISNVIYSNAQNPSPVESSTQKVQVTVTNKVSLGENWDSGRYSPRVEFAFNVLNQADKDIKGIQGTLYVKDMFGVDIMSIECDFTGTTIPVDSSINVSDLGIDINQFMDAHTKLYNEKYENLIFEYEVSSIVYTDGTSE